MINIQNKKITLDQLQAEMIAAGLDVSNGLGTISAPDGTWVHPYNVKGEIAEFVNPTIAANVVTAHVATRPLTDQELNIAFADAMTAVPLDQKKINHILAQSHGLTPRDRVQV